MSDILLLLPADRQVTGAIAAALDLAAGRGAGILAVVVVDLEAAERLSDRIGDRALLGESVTEQVSEALVREHAIRAQALLADITEQARARSVPCRTEIETGDPDAICRRIIERERIATAVVTVEKRSWVARMLAGNQPVRPAHLGGCELVLVEED